MTEKMAKSFPLVQISFIVAKHSRCSHEGTPEWFWDESPNQE
jgi:hypothetical protein